MIARALRHYLLALQFFTRVPVTGRIAHWVGFSESALRASAAHFPGVGWLVGAVAALTWWAVVTVLADGAAAGAPLLAAAVGAVLSTAATLLLTGAFHEDGLADVADGLGGSLDRERAMTIMKDSRLGSFGVLALIVALATKFTLLVALSAHGTAFVVSMLLVAHVLSRLAPLALIRGLDYVEAGTSAAPAKAKPLADAISGQALLVAIAWSLPALLMMAMLVGAAPFAISLVVVAIVMVALARWFRRRLGGFTGDCLGTTQQVVELLIYFCASAVSISNG